VGRFETLADDLIRALQAAGEEFCEEALRATPHPVDALPLESVRCRPRLKALLGWQERRAGERFGYALDVNVPGLRVGVVYSDLKLFGDEERVLDLTVDYTPEKLQRKNFIHSGSLVRREALRISAALDDVAEDSDGHPDWLLWRRVLRHGWTARKQAGAYLYRRHGSSMSVRRNQSYYERASLAKEVVSLFIPLAGRFQLWPRLASFLERQTWPHDQIRLLLFDTSQSVRFASMIRQWLAECPYRDVRCISEPVGARGLADAPRRQVADEVSLAMARIYGRMAEELSTNYVWIVEDDVIPPLDACERLLRGFDQRTGSVSGAYWSRFAKGYVAWDFRQQRYRHAGTGLQSVGGNGFGCVVLRKEAARNSVFTATMPIPSYDGAFYRRLPLLELDAKLNWDVRCRHFDSHTGAEAGVSGRPAMPAGSDS